MNKADRVFRCEIINNAITQTMVSMLSALACKTQGKCCVSVIARAGTVWEARKVHAAGWSG